MKYLRISNQGLIDPKALTLLGASTKRDQSNKIGMFGSGNKYALAYLLRNEIGVRVFAGHNEIKVERKPVEFGDKVFNVIYVNGQETSITDESGPDWVLWQAIREIYSNALDEGEVGFDVTNGISNEENKTQFYIEMTSHVERFVENIEHYFAFDKTFLYKNRNGRVLEKSGDKLNLFRRGIRCYDTEKKSIFDYDLQDIEINESRVVKYDSKAMAAIWSIMLKCDSVVIIKEFLKGLNRDVYENNPYLNYWNEYQTGFSLAWEEAIQGHYFVPNDINLLVPDTIKDLTFSVPSKLYEEIIKKYGKKYIAVDFKDSSYPYQDIEEDPFFENSIDEVKRFFNDVGFEFELPVKVVKFVRNSDGSIKKPVHLEDGTLLLDQSVFDFGLANLAEVLLVNQIHFSASNKNASIIDTMAKTFITYMKRKNARNL